MDHSTPAHADPKAPARLAILNGELAPAAAATIPITDAGLLWGDGVFEVVRIYGGLAFALDEHLDRMACSAAGLKLELDVAALRDDALKLAAAGGRRDALLRIVATRGGRRFCVLEHVPAYPSDVALATIEHEPNPLVVGLKTLSYAGNELATRLVQELGADQAVFVSPAGRLIEGTNFAVFVGFDEGEPIVTPPLSEGILDSITRRRLLSVVPVQERVIEVHELSDAREAFIASTVREVLPVSRIDRHSLPDVPGPRIVAAATAFQASVRAELQLHD